MESVEARLIEMLEKIFFIFFASFLKYHDIILSYNYLI